MKKLFTVVILTICLGFITSAKAQIKEAKIVYKHTIFWSKIYQNMPFLSQSEKDRAALSWGNTDGYTSNMNLYFNENKSLYTYGEAKEDQTYSWRNEDFIIYRDLAERTLIEYEETLGKTYLIKDDMPKIKWRVMNELKEILGHLCMKAITTDTIKNVDIVAWFAADMPVSIGPERFYGLPGVILGMDYNDGDVIIEASSIEPGDITDNLKLPRKMKGREVNVTEMSSLIAEHMVTSMKAQRNPYWSLRY